MAFARNHQKVSAIPDGADTSLIRPSDWNAALAVSGATVGGIPYCPTATSEDTSANFLYTETSGPRLQVGTSGTSAGVKIGYTGSSGDGGMWNSGQTPGSFNGFVASQFHSVIGAPTNGTVYLYGNNGMGGDLRVLPTAGAGILVTAGTAASAVSALSLTQTWNYAGAAINAVDWTFTDTSSHASTNAFRIRGGAAGTTSLLELSKAGQLLIGPGITLAGNGSFDAVATNIGFVQYATRELAVRIGSDGKVIKMDGARLGVGANMSFAFNANADSTAGAFDVNLSRISAGVIGVGTGAAGSFAGRLKLTSAIAAGVAVGSLNAAPTTGEVQSVTDALAPVAGAAVAAGGAAKALVWYNGAQWTVIGV